MNDVVLPNPQARSEAWLESFGFHRARPCARGGTIGSKPPSKAAVIGACEVSWTCPGDIRLIDQPGYCWPVVSIGSSVISVDIAR